MNGFLFLALLGGIVGLISGARFGWGAGGLFGALLGGIIGTVAGYITGALLTFPMLLIAHLECLLKGKVKK